MLNRLCSVCMNTCKQESAVKIVRCPNFRKRLSDDEFRDLMHELDTAEAHAADLSCRVKDLIAKALSGNTADTPPPSSEPFAPAADLAKDE